MKEQIHIYVEKEVKERLEKLAEKDGRSLNNLINKILREFAEGRKNGSYNKPKTTLALLMR